MSYTINASYVLALVAVAVVESPPSRPSQSCRKEGNQLLDARVSQVNLAATAESGADAQQGPRAEPPAWVFTFFHPADRD